MTRPTRITKTSATLIDNIVVNTEWIGKIETKILMEDISVHLNSTSFLVRCVRTLEMSVNHGTNFL